MAGTENIGRALGDGGDHLLAHGEGARLHRRFEPGLLVLEPLIFGAVAEPFFLRLETGGQFLLDGLACVAQGGLQPPRQTQRRAGGAIAGRGQNFAGGLGDYRTGRIGLGRLARTHREMRAPRKDRCGEQTRVRRDEDE